MASGVLSSRVVAQSLCTTPRDGGGGSSSDSSAYDSEVETISMDHAIALVSGWAAAADDDADDAAADAAADDTYLAEHLCVPYAGDAAPPHHLIAYWSHIFEYHGPEPLDCLRLRCLCRLYRDALPPPFVVFPRDRDPRDAGTVDNNLNHHNRFLSVNGRCEENPAHPTLGALFAHLLAKPSCARPQWVVLRAGVYAVECDGPGLACPVTRVVGAGASASETTLFGAGLTFCVDTAWRRIVVKNLTIRDASNYGVLFNLASPANARIEVTDVRVQGAWTGIMANQQAQVVCENCGVTGCKKAAIRAIQGAHVTIRGALTSVAGSVQAAGVGPTGAGSTIILQRPCGLQEADCNASDGGTVTVVDQHPRNYAEENKVGVEQVE